MNGGILVLLPARMAHLASRVLQAGCTPVIDATGSATPAVPEGAWVRTRPGRPAPGTGPVLLAELGAPIPDRPTWLESAAPRAIPNGFAGMVLKGREAGGLCGQEDGLVLLGQCPDPSRVILDAGLGPDTAASAAALGAAGVLLVEPHLGCPELDLGPRLSRRLRLADDELTTLVQGVRVANSPTSPVLRRWLQGEDPWALAEGLYASDDPSSHLWMAGQGLALAAELAQRYGNLPRLLEAYVDAWKGWSARARAATRAPDGTRPVDTAAALVEGTAATVGGRVGSGVLWQEARFGR
ncbi:MAG: hypothetical protein KC656_30170, partial [Myxococcales bacterium]|nr:hypothetical protein [Myxococcales bacterium]